MTTKENLPITDMLEKEFDSHGNIDYLGYLTFLRSQIQSLELSLIEKAKKEEKDRIVVIIKMMIEEANFHTDKMLLQEVIGYINNQP